MAGDQPGQKHLDGRSPSPAFTVALPVPMWRARQESVKQPPAERAESQETVAHQFWKIKKFG